MVLEVRTHFAHRLWVHREHRVWQARRQGFVEDVAEISLDALNGGHLYRRGKFSIEVGEERCYFLVLKADHRAVCVRREEDPTYCSCHRFVMCGQTGYKVTASRAVDVDSLGATRAPGAQSVACKGLRLCFEWEADRIRRRLCSGPPAVFRGQVDSMFCLGSAFADRESRMVHGWERKHWLWEAASRGNPRGCCGRLRTGRCWEPRPNRPIGPVCLGRAAGSKSHPNSRR